MESWRLIIDQPRSGSQNMAHDFAILKGVASGLPPTLRMYRWSPAAVTIGYFQIREDETDYNACLQDGVSVFRRITGGGAVYHNSELTYSVTIPLHNTIAKGSVADTYRLLLQPVVEVMKLYSISAEFRPVNDLTVDGKKISGSAQTRKEGVLLQHGTVLLSIDREKMFRYLKVSVTKTSGKTYSEAGSGITAMDELAEINAFDEKFIEKFCLLIADAYGSIFNVKFNNCALSDDEVLLSQDIERSIFLNEHWNDKRKKST